MEPVDGNGSNTIMLDDLVVGSLRSTPLDQCISISKDTQRILTYVSPPNILDSAGSKTMNTFDLVFANDSILEGRSGFEDEDSVCVASLSTPSKCTNQV